MPQRTFGPRQTLIPPSEDRVPQPERFPRLPAWLTVTHWVLILNMVGQIVYISWQVFVVLQPEGTFGPVFGAAKTMDPALFAARRAYAVEGWLAFIGLAIYLAVTEVLPRRVQLAAPTNPDR
jgi:hypothetical protein